MTTSCFRRHWSRWLLCAVLLFPPGCSSPGAPQDEPDGGVQPDTSSPDTSSPDTEDARLSWRFSGGPSGAVNVVMPVSNRLYAVASSADTWQVLAKSVDDGKTWQDLSGDALDTLVREEQTYLSSVEADGDTLVFSDDALLRRDSQGAWVEVDPAPPHVTTEPSASGALIVYIGRQDDAQGLALSTDGGASWTFERGEPEYRFANVRAWNGKLLAHDYSKLRVSTDGSDQWQVASDEPPLDFARWTFLSDAIVVHESGSDGAQTLHVSDDGLNWQTQRLDDELPAIQTLLGVDERLFALTGDGTVAELGTDGSWSPSSSPPQSGGRFRRAVATDRGFVAIQEGAMLTWTADSGWAESLVERGLARGTPLASTHTTWVKAHDTFFRLRDETWSRVPPRVEGARLTGVVDEKLITADAAHCIYERANGNWRFVAQWREDDAVNTTRCDSSQQPTGRLHGPVVWNGHVLVARDSSPSVLADTSGGVVELPEAVSPDDIAVSDAGLWVAGEGRLLRLSDGAMSDRTRVVSELAGAPQEVIRLWGASQSMLVETTNDASQGRRAFVYRGDSWREIAIPSSLAPFSIVGLNERAVFGVSDGRIWLYDFESRQWDELDEGLPAEARVLGASVASSRVVSMLESGGLWQLRLPDAPAQQ